MGYTTDFSGRFKLNRPLTEAQAAYLTKFCETRRMKRDEEITAGRPDPVREAVGLPVGHEGEYFVGEHGFHGQCDRDIMDRRRQELLNEGVEMRDTWERSYGEIGIIDYNREPSTQPGLWCQWVPSECRNYIEWNGAEKFYNYEEWLQYICDNFLKPWGLTLNGEAGFQGESRDDRGKVYCHGNRVTKVEEGEDPPALLAVATAAVDWEEAEIPEYDGYEDDEDY